MKTFTLAWVLGSGCAYQMVESCQAGSLQEALEEAQKRAIKWWLTEKCNRGISYTAVEGKPEECSLWNASPHGAHITSEGKSLFKSLT